MAAMLVSAPASGPANGYLVRREQARMFREELMLKKLMRCGCVLGFILSLTSAAVAASGSSDARLQKAYRFQQGGWTYVHLEGSPSAIGFQHGYLLAPEIADAFAAIKL